MLTKMYNYPTTTSALCSSIASTQASSCSGLVAGQVAVLLFYQMMTCVIDMELLQNELYTNKSISSKNIYL